MKRLRVGSIIIAAVSGLAARDAQAGDVVGPTQVIFRFAAAEARENGVQVVLFTINATNRPKHCKNTG
jgi:hypothetical protein